MATWKWNHKQEKGQTADIDIIGDLSKNKYLIMTMIISEPAVGSVRQIGGRALSS